VVTSDQRVECAIVGSLFVYHEPAYVIWAEGWLSGRDRSAEAAAASASEAWAAWEAAAAAVWAARGAAWAARGAAWGAARAAAWAVAWALESNPNIPLAEIARAVVTGQHKENEN